MEPLPNVAERFEDDRATNPSEQLDDAVDIVNRLDWTPLAPAVTLGQNSGMVSSNGQIVESWQEQVEPMERAQQGNLQLNYRPPVMQLEEQLGYCYSDPEGDDRQTSAYPSQIWPMVFTLPDHSAHTQSLPPTFNTDLHSFRSRFNETSSLSGSGNGGTRHIGDEQSIWYPANQNTAPTGFGFQRALYFQPMASSSHYPSTHAANVYASLSPGRKH